MGPITVHPNDPQYRPQAEVMEVLINREFLENSAAVGSGLFKGLFNPAAPLHSQYNEGPAILADRDVADLLEECHSLIDDITVGPPITVRRPPRFRGGCF